MKNILFTIGALLAFGGGYMISGMVLVDSLLTGHLPYLFSVEIPCGVVWILCGLPWLLKNRSRSPLHKG